jgi:transposase-like protein
MVSCPKCDYAFVKKSGVVKKKVMTKAGKKTTRYQAYRCENGHYFTVGKNGRFSDSFVETVVYMYLRCLSLNTTVDIIRMFYEEDVLSKGQVLDFIEIVADRLPTLAEVDTIYQPRRSGFVAMDGTWFSFNDEQIVLLVAFDPVSFDIIAAIWESDETELGYERLLTEVINKLGALSIKGIYGDGDNGLIRSRKRLLPHVPFQLCVFHKELRMGQVVPIKSLHISKQFTNQQKHEIKTFQFLFREVIYAKTKEVSIEALERLGHYVKQQKNPRFDKAYRSLKTNFAYTLTHFDYEEMERDNNILECFNGIIKPRLKLMKSFKKKQNLDRYLKLFLLEYRFHPLKESSFKDRRGQSPLQLGDVFIPESYNFITFLRKSFNFNFF